MLGIEDDVVFAVREIGVALFWFEEAVTVRCKVKVAVINIIVLWWWDIFIKLFRSPNLWWYVDE